MIKNYFKIAIRNLWRNKLFSFVNIFGLALSMAVGVLIFSELKTNYDTDHFHPKLNQIVRILTKETIDGRQSKWATSPLPLAGLFANAPFIEKTVQVRFGGKYNLQTNNGNVPVDITFSEPSFFDIFGFKLLTGNAKNLADNPSTIFLTEQTAKKIFGRINVIGQTVQFENLGTYIVEGIIEDPALQTHLPIEAMCSMAAAQTLEKNAVLNTSSQNWNDYKSSALYVRLNNKGNLNLLNSTLKSYSRKIDKTTLEFEAQPLENITPRSQKIENDNNAGIDKSGIITLLFLIFSLTLLSAFNYISLSLARALSRAKEIGVRKTVGATRWQISKQFLTEAIIISMIALLVSIPFVFFLMNNIAAINFVFRFDIYLLIGLLTYGLLTGLIAGILPARILSTFQPVQILRKMKNIKLLRSVGIYKILIVVQFSVTIMMMVFFVILTDFEKKNTATINSVLPPNVLTLDLKGENYENIRNEISQLSQVKTVLATNWYYDAYKLGSCSMKWNNKIQKLNYVSIDPKTVEAEAINLKLGNNFPKSTAKNIEQFVLLNEAAAKSFTLDAANIVGQNVTIDTINVQVIGIMPNQATGNPIPLVYRYLPNEIVALTIKIKPGSEQAIKKACIGIWKHYHPQKTADVHNLKDKYSGKDALEMMGFFGFFASLIMIIAALGILGIASYSVEIRTKELGIRKVLGANKIKLVWTVTKNFGMLILVAGLFGIPAGMFCGNLLRNRLGSNVDVGAVNLLIGFGLVAVTGLITVLSQTIRAGQVNPVKILKSE
jgi:putative ABC transport system permease protein